MVISHYPDYIYHSSCITCEIIDVEDKATEMIEIMTGIHHHILPKIWQRDNKKGDTTWRKQI